MTEPLITDEDKAMGLESPVLGANWNVARRIAEKVTEGWQDAAFKKLIDNAVDAIRERLWEDVQFALQADTETNIAYYIRGMVDETVQALLTGERWALERYPLARYHDGEKIRAAIAKHIAPEIMDKRIAELEAENTRLAESNAWLRR